jgi:hypothetical protein
MSNARGIADSDLSRLTVDSTTLVVDDTNNRVGIGTSSPASPLHIYKTSYPGIRLDDGTAYSNIYNDSTNGSLVYSADDGNARASSSHQFYVDGTEAMRIDYAGRVTMPYQPCFQVWNNGSDFAISASAKITCFQAEDFDVGSNYNTGNQIFTAPISGYYMFGAHFRMGAPGAIRVFRAELFVNGVYQTDLATCGGTNNYDGSSGYDHPPAVGSTILYLNSNDYVELKTSAEFTSTSTVYIQGGKRSHWYGYLLG